MIKKIMQNDMLWILIASAILAFMIVGYAQSTGLIIDRAAGYQYFPNENALGKQASPDCSHARAYIKEGGYDPRTHMLKLEISNIGRINLSFLGFLTYKNGTLVRYPSLGNVMAGETMTLEMAGVEPGLDQATVQSKECPDVQDLLYYYDIKGMT